MNRVMFTVGRLVRVKEIVRTEVSRESRFNNTFDYFGHQRKVRNGPVNRELVIVQGIPASRTANEDCLSEN